MDITEGERKKFGFFLKIFFIFFISFFNAGGETAPHRAPVLLVRIIKASEEQRAGESGPNRLLLLLLLDHPQYWHTVSTHTHTHSGSREERKSMTDAPKPACKCVCVCEGLPRSRAHRTRRSPASNLPDTLENSGPPHEDAVTPVVRTCRDTGCSSRTFLRVSIKEVPNFTVRGKSLSSNLC